jgi:trk system potassium uptake protein TrkA
LAEVDLHEGWIGHSLTSIEAAAGIRVAFLTRFGEGLLPQQGTAYQEGDTVHAMLSLDRTSEISRVLGKAPAKEF